MRDIEQKLQNPFSGSILQQDGDLDAAFDLASRSADEERINALRSLKLRYFTPYEVAKLMGFPKADFNFPPEYIQKPHLCYRVLGNSLNVTVVSMLTTILIKSGLP